MLQKELCFVDKCTILVDFGLGFGLASSSEGGSVRLWFEIGDRVMRLMLLDVLLHFQLLGSGNQEWPKRVGNILN